VLIESRTIGWIFPREIPAVRIWLLCDLSERLRRVQDREHHPRSAENLLRREASDNRRYQELYGIEDKDFSPFDLVIDTTRMSVDASRQSDRIVCARARTGYGAGHRLGSARARLPDTLW